MIANERANHTPGDTYRSKNGKCRVTFMPDWSETLPWVSYINGTASLHYGTLLAAKFQMQHRYGINIQLVKS